MRSVKKYILHACHVAFNMPPDAVILNVQERNGTLCLFTLEDVFPDTPMVCREFRYFPTNAELSPGNLKYIGTARRDGRQDSGLESLVDFHVFEVLKGESK